MPASWRPDKSGIIITGRDMIRGCHVVFLSQLWIGAIDTPIGRTILEFLTANGCIIFWLTDGGAVCRYKHTGLVLDDAGEKDLFQSLASERERDWTQIVAEVGENRFAEGAKVTAGRLP